MIAKKIGLSIAALLLLSAPVFAQAIGGNASLSVTTSSARVALPANTQKYSSVLIAPVAASTQEVFYLLGDSSVAAQTTSPALPSGGICLNVGPSTNVAAITASSSATLRITQLTTCTGFAAAGSGGGGGGGGFTPTPVAPTVGASASVTSLVLKNTPTANPGGVTRYHAENATATSGYCVLYNATAAPGTGALTAGLVLDFQILPPSGYCDVDHTLQPIAASAGAVVLLTSAANPYTYTTGAITGSISGVAQ